MSSQRKPSMIKTIKDIQSPSSVAIRTNTDELDVWGEGTLEGHTEAVEGVYQEFRDRFIGCDADNIEDIWQTGYRLGFYRGGPFLMSALSGLDIALWDIKGEKLGIPVWQLLGGKVRDRVPVYGWIGGDRPSDVIDGAMLRKSQGFTAVKIYATEPIAWLESPSCLTEAVNGVAHVKSIGLDVGVDFHGRLHKPVVKQLAKMLEPLQPLFIEAWGDRRLGPYYFVPNRLFTRHDFRPYLECRAMDIPQPDIHYNKRADCFTYLNDTSVFDIKEGFILTLEGPGLGIAINETAVKEAAEIYKGEKAWRNAVPRGPDNCLQEW